MYSGNAFSKILAQFLRITQKDHNIVYELLRLTLFNYVVLFSFSFYSPQPTPNFCKQLTHNK